MTQRIFHAILSLSFLNAGGDYGAGNWCKGDGRTKSKEAETTKNIQMVATSDITGLMFQENTNILKNIKGRVSLAKI